MSSVALLLVHDRDLHRIQQASQMLELQVPPLRRTDRFNDLIRICHRGNVVAAVLDPFHPSIARVEDLATFLTLHGAIPVLLYGSVPAGTTLEAMQALFHGNQTWIATRDFSDSVGALSTKLSEMLSAISASLLAAHLNRFLDRGQSQVVMSFLKESPGVETLTALAKRLETTTRQLERTCEGRGLPEPRWLHRWARVFRASWLVLHLRQKEGSAALAVGYSDGRSLRRALKATSQLSIGDIRDLEVTQLLRRFAASLRLAMMDR